MKRYALRSLVTLTLLAAAGAAKADFFYCYADDGTTVYFSSLHSCPPSAASSDLQARFAQHLASSRGKPVVVSSCPRDGERPTAAASRDKDIEDFRKRGRTLLFDQWFVPGFPR